jgi:hypothetical protein
MVKLLFRQNATNLVRKFTDFVFNVKTSQETLYEEIYENDSICEAPAGHAVIKTYTVLGMNFRSRKNIWDEPL